MRYRRHGQLMLHLEVLDFRLSPLGAVLLEGRDSGLGKGGVGYNGAAGEPLRSEGPIYQPHLSCH